MENLLKKIEELGERFLKTKALLDIDQKIVKLQELRQAMSKVDFWNDQNQAIEISQAAEELNSEIEKWRKLENDIQSVKEILALSEKEENHSLTAELEEKYYNLEKDFSRLEFLSLFSEEYDNNNALLAIHAGTGGVDAQDWTAMLERMYLRFAEQHNWQSEILDHNYGNEAGVKSVVMRLIGSWAYGFLKSENGVHRLLRNSPFDADGLRHTSFALVEVIPEIKDDNTIVIKDDDLRIDVFRSSGPGGQSVNTTDSAVRITHLPSGLVVSCQSERSQHHNRENALKILKNKLYQLALQEKEAAERKLKGEVQKAEWGKQIRSYFLYGNRLIKDHRSNYETSDIEAVLNGHLEDFMEAYLRWLKKKLINS